MLRASAIAVAFALSCANGEGTAQPVAIAPTQAPAIVVDAPSKPTRAPSVASKPAHASVRRLGVDADGHELAVWFKSHAQPRDAIVLVHGRTWSARPDFDLQVPGESRSLMDSLADDGFAVYAVDLRGYGETLRDGTGWLTPDRAAKDVAIVLAWVHARHEALPRPALLGWSLGSMVSQLTAQRHGELVSSVILYGYPRKPGAKVAADPATPSEPDRAATTAKGAAEDFIVAGAISSRAVEAFVAAALAADPIRADWRASEQWNALDPKALKVPTLVIHGVRDPYAPERNQARLFEALAHADREWVILPGCDHAAHLEVCGPRFVQAVTAFIRRPVAG